MADRGARAWRWLERDLPPASGPFADPGRDEAWWWLAIPLVCAVLPPVIYRLDPAFYNDAINPEPWGLLELSHVMIPLAAFALAIAILRDPLVWRSLVLRLWIGVAALGSLYIAGEEASWGQHFIGWETPEFWGAINRQDETNLHNVSSWLNQKPRGLLLIGIVVGGLILPLALRYSRKLRGSPVSLLIPPITLMPTALLLVVYYAIRRIQPLTPDSPWIVTRPSEVEETFLYLFVLFYLVVFRRRIAQLRPAGAEGAAADTAKA